MFFLIIECIMEHDPNIVYISLTDKTRYFIHGSNMRNREQIWYDVSAETLQRDLKLHLEVDYKTGQIFDTTAQLVFNRDDGTVVYRLHGAATIVARAGERVYPERIRGLGIRSKFIELVKQNRKLQVYCVTPQQETCDLFGIKREQLTFAFNGIIWRCDEIPQSKTDILARYYDYTRHIIDLS